MAKFVLKILLIFSLVLEFLQAQDFHNATDFELWGGVRKRSQDSLVSVKNETQFFYGDYLELIARPELRLFQGSGVSRQSRSTYYLNAKPAKQAVPLEWRITDGEYMQSYLLADALFARIKVKDIQLEVGRSPVSLGVLKYFPLWNRFSRPGVHAYGPGKLVIGRDSAKIRMQYGSVSFEGLGVFSHDREHQAGSISSVWYGDGVELHGLAGFWMGEFVGGLAGVKDFAGITWKVESLIYDEGFQIGVNGDYVFNERWGIWGEAIVLTEGALYATDSSFILPLYSSVLDHQVAALVQLEWKPAGLLQTNLGWLTNAMSGTQYISPSVDYSLADSMELTLSGSLAFGPEDKDYFKVTGANRPPSSLSIDFKASF